MTTKKPFPKLPAGAILIIIAASLWAIDGVLRRSVYSLSPLTIVFYEHLIGAIILLPLFLKQLKTESISKQSWLNAGFVALVSGLLGTMWFTTALLKTQFISFSVVYLLQKLQPLFAAGSAAIILKERLTPKYLAWASLALVAAYFVTFPGGIVRFDTGSGTTITALYALGAAAAWGVSTTVSKRLVSTQSTVVSTGLRFILTSIFGLMAVVLIGQMNTLSSISLPQIGTLGIIALSTGMVAIMFYYRGLKTTQAKVSTILELTFPVLAIAIDAVVYKSMLQPTQLLAGMVLLYAMYQVGSLKTSNKKLE
ncbi:MAG: EamA family transporter [Candidatus Pacebacteria bacterium CG_4_10_14_0_8_um_filter_42_14]|nr:MAG: EamA family transporter [Candidatus Pacebacteria bacterium CG_4_10_14_0_8_um_filter_42_14]